MRSLARIALVVSLMVSIGGHWGVLQAIAWAQMLQDYSAEKGLAEGIMDTFSGERPCPMCLKLRKTQSDTEKHNAPIPKQKSDPTLKWADPFRNGAITLKPPTPQDKSGTKFRPVIVIPGEGRTRPPTPPPRGAQPA